MGMTTWETSCLVAPSDTPTSESLLASEDAQFKEAHLPSDHSS